MDEINMKQKRILGFSLGIFLIVVNICAILSSMILKKTSIINDDNKILISYIINAVSIYIIGYLTLKLILKNVKKIPKREKKKIKFTEVLLLLCITIGGAQLTNFVTQIIINIIKIICHVQINNNVTDLLQSSNPILMIIFASLLGPIMEELIFRGTIMEKLRAYGDKTAIIYTSIAFGLFHCNFAQIPFAIVVGFILGYAKVKTNSLTIPILFHILLNSMSVILMICMQKMQFILIVPIILLVFVCIILTLIFVPIRLTTNKVVIDNNSQYSKKGLYKNIGYIFSVIAIVILTIVSSIV